LAATAARQISSNGRPKGAFAECTDAYDKATPLRGLEQTIRACRAGAIFTIFFLFFFFSLGDKRNAPVLRAGRAERTPNDGRLRVAGRD